MTTKPVTLQIEERSIEGARRSFPKDLSDLEWTIRQIQQPVAMNLLTGERQAGEVVLIMTGKLKQPTTIDGEVAENDQALYLTGPR